MTPCEASIFQAHHRRVGPGHRYVPRSPAHKAAYEREIAAMDRAYERYEIQQGAYLDARIRGILEEAQDAKKEWAKHMKYYPGKRNLKKDIEVVEKAANQLNKIWKAKP